MPFVVDEDVEVSSIDAVGLGGSVLTFAEVVASEVDGSIKTPEEGNL